MCVMSMIIDHHYDRWNPQISSEEIAEFYELLERARAYDKAHGQPNCELESKKEKLTKLAKDLGVEITFP